MSWQYVPLNQGPAVKQEHEAKNEKEKGYWRYDNPIEIPSVDERKYELIKLQNELQVLLVSDPTVDLAAISLDVGVGHMSDPDDMPGLAHFCEHLSFMGTEAFPVENEYKKYIKMHSGATNASTYSQRTTYHFKVDARFLSGAMERFAGFFHSPLFRKECVGKEVNAVDSENGKNQQMDSRRLYQLWKGLSDADHPWNKFGCGNKTTLLKDESTGGEEETRRRVVEWWEKHYCASRMKVAIVGADSLETLAGMAYENFSSIKNKNLGPCIPTTKAPWTSTEPKLIFAKTIKDTQRLELSFPIPYQMPLYRTKPSQHISHLVGHEGPGSVFYFLHQQGLATALSCGSHEAGRGVSLLDVDITLTKTGLKEYRKVLAVLFHYLTLLPASLSQSHHFTELRTMAQIGFDYTSKRPSDDYAKALSQSMNEDYDREHIISHGVKTWEFNKTDVEDIIACLGAQKARIILAAKNFEGVDVPDEWMQEKWYGTDYAMQEFNPDALPVLSADESSALYLPEKNPFLPESLHVDRLDVVSPLTEPSIIKETPRSILWHKKDDQFWRPRGSVSIRIDTPMIHASLSRVMLTRMYVELVKDALVAPGYAAELAGISYAISFSTNGIDIGVSGYNEKLLSVLVMVMEHLRDLKITRDRFDIVMEKVKRMYDNAYLRQTSEMVDLFLSNCTEEKLYTSPEKRKELEFIDIEHVKSHAKKLLEAFHLTVLAHGNISREQAVSWLDDIEQLLAGRGLSLSERIARRSLLIPAGTNYIFKSPVPNSKETNSGISYFCRTGDIANAQIRATTSFLASIMNEPFFNIMRTTEQLGYSVSCLGWSETATIGLKFRVQSFRHPDFLEARIDAFIDSYLQKLREMPSEEFEAHKRGAIAKKREKLMNLGQEKSRFWSHIVSGYQEFERAECDAREIEKIELGSLVQFYERYIHPSSPTRSKLSVRLTSQAMEPEGRGEQSTVAQGVRAEEHEDIAELRRNFKLSACPIPISNN